MQTVIDALAIIGGTAWFIVGLYFVYALCHLPLYLLGGRRKD